MSLDLDPAMVNILPNEGSGFECEAGVSKYVNTSPGGDSVYVNVCCTDTVAIPEAEASTVALSKPTRETSNSSIESARYMMRFLCGDFPVDNPVFLILIISESFGRTQPPALRATPFRGRGLVGWRTQFADVFGWSRGLPLRAFSIVRVVRAGARPLQRHSDKRLRNSKCLVFMRLSEKDY